MKLITSRKRISGPDWVYRHMQITKKHVFDRVPLPDKREHVGRRGRKTTDQGWSLTAGLPKEQPSKGRRLRQFCAGCCRSGHFHFLAR